MTKENIVLGDYIPATPYAKYTAKEKGIDLSSVTPTGKWGEVKYCDVIKAVQSREDKVKMTPLATRMAKAMGIEPSHIKGSGYAGKIKKVDLFQISIEKKEDAEEATRKWDGKREPLSGMRKVIARRMTQSQQEIPSVTNTVKNDVTALLETRKKLNENRGVKLSINDFILKAVATALENNRNILVNLDGDEVIYRREINLGMAVAVEGGLLVPVIRNANELSLFEISKISKDIAEKARSNKLTPDDYQGSTFSISNLGMYAVESFTPIINQPDAAILGVNTVQEELAMENGSVVVKKVMRTSLTFDHRLLDGAAAAKFQLAIKKLLENPIEIIL